MKPAKTVVNEDGNLELDESMHGSLTDWRTRRLSFIAVLAIALIALGFVGLSLSIVANCLWGLENALPAPSLAVIAAGAALLGVDWAVERRMPYSWRIEGDFVDALRLVGVLPRNWQRKHVKVSVHPKRRQRFAVIEFSADYPNATLEYLTANLEKIKSCLGVEYAELMQNPERFRSLRAKEFVLKASYVPLSKLYERSEGEVPMERGDSMSGFTVGYTPTAREIKAGVAKGFLAIVAGQSGSGKTNLTNNILLQMMRTYRERIQFVVIDPKRVGFLPFKERCYLLNGDEGDWTRALQALVNEMNRRYERMERAGLDSFPVSEADPYILLVIDELSAVMNPAVFERKKERDAMAGNLVDLACRMRQCGMGMLLIMQSASTDVVPSAVRVNCSTRFALKTSGDAMVKMISGDRPEECPCDLLQYPGEFYACTSETAWRFVRGRTWKPDKARDRAILESVKNDKRYLYCMDWDNPDFLG
ncbi:FtsK/SpoIIIE domain-containing protein [Eggerthella lenta]|nr:FtsK/SpoIIIE domain-containing protein [Eggerthella lenta]